jgi:hypothetical protein
MLIAGERNLRGSSLLLLIMQSLDGLHKNHDPCRGVNVLICMDVNTPNGVAAETLYKSRDATTCVYFRFLELKIYGNSIHWAMRFFYLTLRYLIFAILPIRASNLERNIVQVYSLLPRYIKWSQHSSISTSMISMTKYACGT